MKLLLPLLVVAGLVAGPPTPAHAIAHGTDVAPGRYPFSALLSMTGIPTADHGRRDSSCSGALIAPRWLVTAGHCFRDAGDHRVSRPVAASTVATVGRTERARVIAVHQSGTADVALAELDHPITGITPLAVATAPPRPGEVVRLTGFGLTGADAEGDHRLRTGTFTVTTVGDAFVGMAGRAPRADTSACPHDSGGPYFRTRSGGAAELVGVVSRGPSCPHTGDDLSARTDNLAGWIDATVAGRGSGPSRLWWLLLPVLAAAIVVAIRQLRPRSRPGMRSS
jgi:hypothetical protein